MKQINFLLAICLFFALSGCSEIRTTGPQIDESMTVEPPIMPGFYVLGKYGEESSAVKLGPSHNKSYAVSFQEDERQETCQLRFAKLNDGKFLTEVASCTKKLFSNDLNYMYSMIELGAGFVTFNVVPTFPSAATKSLRQAFGFNGNGEELSHGTRRDILELFNRTLALEKSGGEVLDRSFVFRRVDEIEFLAAVARIRESARLRREREAQEKQGSRNNEENLNLLAEIRSAMRSSL